MKKGIVCGVTTVMLAVAFLGTACDKNAGPKKSYEELSSDIVTEAEWIAAFSKENFINISAEMKIGQEDNRLSWEHKEIRTGTYVVKQDGNTIYMALKYGKYENYAEGELDSEGRYVSGLYSGNLQVEEGDINYWWTEHGDDQHSGFSPIGGHGMRMETYFTTLNKNGFIYDSIWKDAQVAWEFSNKQLDDDGDGTYILSMPVDFFADNYSEFTYSEEEKGYVLIDKQPGYTPGKYIIKFQNGKVSAVMSICGDIDVVDFENEEYQLEYYSWVFYDYGTTSVKLPAEFQQKIDEYNSLNQ